MPRCLAIIPSSCYVSMGHILSRHYVKVLPKHKGVFGYIQPVKKCVLGHLVHESIDRVRYS